MSFSLSVIGPGWASVHPLTSRSTLIMCLIWLVMGVFGFALWPKPKAEALLHPIITVSTTSVSYKPDTRELTVGLTFVNLSSFDVEAKLHMHLLWGGPHFSGKNEMLKETAIDRVIAMGPQPNNFAFVTSYTLTPEEASLWIGKKVLIMVGAAATYADKDAATEYDFAGSIRVKQNFVDVDTSRWFTRPAAPPFTETFLSFPPAKNPSHCPSGEKKGVLVPSVPATGLASRLSSPRR